MKQFYSAFTLALILTIALALTFNTVNAQVVVNGGFEFWGPNCPVNVAPNNWTNFSNTLGPDQAGCAGPVVSYQGNSHMNLVWADWGLWEGAEQTISGFTPGSQYTIAFYAIHDQGLYASTGSLFLDVYLNSNVIFSTPELFNGGPWTQYTTVFTAASTSETIGFKIRTGNTGTSSSVGIDQFTVDMTAGVKDIPLAMDFNIYPNPVQGELNINFNTSVSSGSLSIVNLVGQLVYTQQEISGTSVKVELPKLSPGVYFINVNNRSAVLTKKIVIY
jgi:hypothetical protein